MSPHDQKKINAIERDRKRREDELLLALLLLMDDARRDSVVAIRHGFSYATVIGNTTNRAVNAIATSMADAHRDGFTRMQQLTDSSFPLALRDRRDWLDEHAGTVGTLATAYRPAAQDAATAMNQTLTNALNEYQAGASDIAPGTSLIRAVRQVFDNAGYTANSPRALDLATERAIIGAHNTGMYEGGQHLQEKVTGLRHMSVIDERTTDRCRERDGLVLPISDPYWTENIPPLHWNCRSAVLPVIGEFSPSDWRPSIPPAPGFGLMSATFLWRLGAAA